MAPEFDVFLSHNSRDKAVVENIGEWLKGRGLHVWLDKWELRPGFTWQEGVEEGVRSSRAVAVFVGSDGLGAWQEPETRAFIATSRRKQVPIIPVLLPGCPDSPQLTLFVEAFTWVDLRQGLSDDCLAQLAWGITGEKPPCPRKDSSLGRRSTVRRRRTVSRWTAGLSLLAVLALTTTFWLRSPLPPRPVRSAIPKGRAAIGVMVAPVTAEYGLEHGFPTLESGVVIQDLLPSGPAALAGIKTGDIIRRIDGKPASIRDFGQLVGGARLEVWRGSERMELMVIPMDSVQLYQRACSQRDGYGCWSAGELYRVGAVVEKDPPLAFSFYDQGCNLGSLRACDGLGYAYETGFGVYRNPTRAISLYRQACDGAEFGGCINLGFLYLGEHDSRKAVELFELACNGGLQRGCQALGFQLLDGEGFTKDVGRAGVLFRKGCNDGDMASCTALGYLYDTRVDNDTAQIIELLRKECDNGGAVACDNLGRRRTDGKGIKLDLEAAVVLFEQACKAGNSIGCFDLANQLVTGGDGLTKDLKRAEDLYSYACYEGYAWDACNALGMMIEGRDLQKAMALFQNACDGGSLPACTNLGRHLIDGTGIAPDFMKAFRLLVHTCVTGYNDGCHYLATDVIPKIPTRDGGRYITLFEHEEAKYQSLQIIVGGSYIEACIAGETIACDYFGRKLREKKDLQTAVIFFDKACTRGNAVGCYDLATQILAGAGTKKNPQRAGDLFISACASGVQEACGQN